MLEQIKERVFKANISLQEYKLITLTWGNVSEIDRETGYVIIKPSGVSYNDMTPDDMVVVDLNGNKIEGKLNPSSDTPTHLELYRKFPSIGGITHTHSRWATIFSQAQMSIPILGTTHADAFYGDIPCTRKLTSDEIFGEYELETGKVIAELFTQDTISKIPGALVCSHGPFTWGKDAMESVKNAVILEEVAMMAWHTLKLNSDADFQKELSDKHYLRKHGENAYYGQKELKK
ncbi:MAG: L-ribulose-5-phosphate 4-epimerase [Clostridia bacterium]|nr:L-ribulose-5-phosphate 4-epimerase [Clostridia bacterium]